MLKRADPLDGFCYLGSFDLRFAQSVRPVLFFEMTTSTLQGFEPLAFQDLDFRSRAITSLVDDSRLHKKTYWKLSDVVAKLLDAVALARSTSRNFVERIRAFEAKTLPLVDPSSLPLVDLGALIQSTAGCLAALRRLEGTCRNMADFIDSLQNLGVEVKVAEVQECSSELAEFVQICETFLEDLEWAESERTAIPSCRLDGIAEYCRSTGQASV